MSTTEPLVYTFTVACLPDHAFDTWTARINRWWPKDHSISGDPDPTIQIEGFVGGRIIERDNDGTEYEWGRVTLWEPPTKLAYTWFPGATPERPTVVELTFVEEDGKTTVHLVNSGWELLGPDGAKRREGNEQGWSAVLGAYQSHLEEG